MDAIVFDFDGVLVDSEPIHCQAFAEVLKSVGVNLTREDYYARYLGFDDHDCIAAVMRDHGKPCGEALIAGLKARKTVLVQAAIRKSIRALPGAPELVRSAATAGVPLAICSGALREEIELALRTVALLDRFSVIVAAEDVKRGKPDPEGFVLAMERLGKAKKLRPAPARSVAIEDSPAGIAAAKGAGMKVAAVTTSYQPDQLRQADCVVDSPAQLTVADLERL